MSLVVDRPVERINPKRVSYQLSQVGLALPARIKKRDGSYAAFDLRRIESAIQRCYDELAEPPVASASSITGAVANAIAAKGEEVPTVEQVQDFVEMSLLARGEFDAARTYILYRDQRTRDRGVVVPVEVQEAFDADKEFFPTVLQQFQFYDKYSRYNWEKGRRETWVETVDRVVDYLRWLADGKLDESIFRRLHEGILNMKVMPSMRALAMAGEPAKRNSMAIYNCHRGEEKYLTPGGLKTLVDTAGTTQMVLNGDGRWVQADIKEFGVQSLQEITFRPGRRSNTKLRHRVQSTPNHRWITTNRGEVTDLKVGDCVRFVGAPTPTAMNADAWIAGFGFGDGTITAQGEAQVRLCGDKAKYLSVFEKYGHCGVYTPLTNDGDPTIIFHKGHFTDWKKLPKGQNASWLASWLDGYLAADGHRQANDAITLGSQDNEAIEFVSEIAPLAGYMVTGRSTMTNMTTNFGPRSAPLQSLLLRREGEFIVTAIEDLEYDEPVFCAVVPDGHDFVLANGIHTGNCSYMAVSDPQAFVEAMLLSMAGCGVGFSVESEYVEQLHRVKRQKKHQDPTTHVVEDSTEGWANALRLGLAKWWAGEDIHFDFSAVRPAGMPLKVKGGRASGPEPLRASLAAIRGRILSRQGSFLRPLDCLDIMCWVGDAAVSGGVRRTAMICLFDWWDSEVRNCKNGANLIGNEQRWNSNNSACWPEDISVVDLMSQMLEMAEGNRGEPGIFSRTNANRTKPKRRKRGAFGCNPCVTGDTVIATVDGPRTFADLAESESDVLVYAWHPETKVPVIRWMRRPHRTRIDAEIFAVTFDSGLVVRCTPDHSFYSFRGQKVQARDLRVGQSIRAFSASRDSSGHERIHAWDSQRNTAIHQWTHRMIWEAHYGDIPEGMVVAHLDNDGTNNNLDNLSMMTDLAHRQYDMPMRQAAGFDGHSPNHKVVSVKSCGYEDVYNGCVDDAHTYIILDQEPVAGHMSGIVSANCGEINLRDMQLCNLSIAVARPDDTVETLREKVELATIIGTIQSLATNFPGMRSEWKRNCEDERLLGVDITGQMDCPVVRNDGVLSSLRDHSVEVNKTIAQMLNINPSASITCNKPSGNSSQFLNCASGLHARWAEWYIRNVRVSAHTPLYRVLKEAGVPMSPENGQTAMNATTWVIHFPVASPAGSITRNGRSAVEQCEHWLLNKVYWTEHNPSCTITYQPEELIDLTAWVYKHKDVIGGLSFLPADNASYDQMPYEEITKEEYEVAAAAFPEVNFARIFAYEQSDMTTAAQELACLSGACDI